METIAYGMVWVINHAGEVHPVVVQLMGVAALAALLVNVRRGLK